MDPVAYSFATPPSCSLGDALPPDLVPRIVASFARDGVVFLPQVLARESVEAARLAAETAIEGRGGFVEGGALKGDDGWQRVVSRGWGRFDMHFGPTQPESSLHENPVIQAVVDALLGEAELNFTGAIMALPGAVRQKPHTDGPHHSEKEHLPVLVLSVFIPLVDVVWPTSATCFAPGSHMDRVCPDLEPPEADGASTVSTHWCRMDMRQGDVMILDYRTYHYGSEAPAASLRRPVAYAVFSKPGYRDDINQHEYTGGAKATGTAASGDTDEDEDSDSDGGLQPLFSEVAMFG
jgi:ectoine hydroxylase-related dioxygenase (phytanoyl-CoA dioxygenase family)